MKSIYYFQLIAILMLLASCSQNSYVSSSEYDDLYVSSADIEQFKEEQRTVREKQLDLIKENESQEYRNPATPAEPKVLTPVPQTSNSTSYSGYDPFWDRYDRRPWSYCSPSVSMGYGYYYGNSSSSSYYYPNVYSSYPYYSSYYYNDPWYGSSYYNYPYYYNPYYPNNFYSNGYSNGYYNGFYNGYYSGNSGGSGFSGGGNSNYSAPKTVNKPKTSVSSTTKPAQNSGTNTSGNQKVYSPAPSNNSYSSPSNSNSGSNTYYYKSTPTPSSGSNSQPTYQYNGSNSGNSTYKYNSSGSNNTNTDNPRRQNSGSSSPSQNSSGKPAYKRF